MDTVMMLPNVLKPRAGITGGAFKYNQKYRPFLERANLLVFSNSLTFVKRSAVTIDHAVLSALGDRWYDDTNTSHFPCGEMTLTLEDVAMIQGLPGTGDVVSLASIKAEPDYVEFLGKATLENENIRK